MGNAQNFLSLEVPTKDMRVSLSDSTLLSGSTSNSLIDYGQNTKQRNGMSAYSVNTNDERTYEYVPRQKELKDNKVDYNRAFSDTPPYIDCYGSPLTYSDQSTDGESGVSDIFKNMIPRDRFSTVSETNSILMHPLPNKLLNVPPSLMKVPEIPYTCALDINIDYTLHVGKLVIYMKQIRFNISRVEEFALEGFRIRGKIKSSLLNPTKGQRNSSNIFEASIRDSKIVYADLDDVFVFYLFPRNGLASMSLSFKVCVCKKIFREFNLGESIMQLGDLDLNAEMLPTTITFGENVNLPKKPKSLLSVVMPKSEKLEILVSLEYKIEISKLFVNVDQTTKLDELRYESKREIIIQAELVSPSCECVQRKTTFLKITEENPGSNKVFQFDLPQEDLLINTLMLSVSFSATRWLQQEKIGWIAFGRNCSGQVEAEHWDMMISQSQLKKPAVQWHCLCESPDTNKSHTLITRVFK
ncbi:synaptotagmin-16 [Hydra vulgaris]|uniref:synaptotagmin-16 n=1 Tax=Hydra vulgaris TaxID=6087 RepID=UPI001F5F79C7|nr:synaptotagmin-16 [Hydra vulgaris]